jgi:hypothetical protein
MLFSVFAGLFGMFLPSLAVWVALPARFLLGSMLNIAEWFASWPNATALVTISSLSMILLYGIIAIFITGLNKRAQSVIINNN